MSVILVFVCFCDFRVLIWDSKGWVQACVVPGGGTHFRELCWLPYFRGACLVIAGFTLYVIRGVVWTALFVTSQMVALS